jgi:tripartite-type tricarboxylate transporter receptor subunit TctC
MDMVIMRVFFAALLALCLIFSLGHTGKAATKKCLHIRVIVPSAVGTATDLIIRAYAETINRQQSGPLLKVLNKTQNTVIEKNMNGRPDGCQILAVTQSLVSNFLSDKTNIEWSKFAPIAMLSRTPMAVVARGNLRDANLANIIEVALQNPNVVLVGETSNPLEQMFRMSLEDVSGVRFKVTVFETARQSFLELLANNLDLGIVSASAAKRRMDLKQLKIVAITERLETEKLVGVLSLKDQGIDLSFGVDRGIVAPIDTPPEIIARIMERFQKASDNPELENRLGKIYTRIMFLDPDSYTQYFENLTADWSEMIERVEQRPARTPG